MTAEPPLGGLPVAGPVRAPARLSLAACICSIVMTSLGLAAAGLDVRWGTSHLAGDALRSAWLYVGVMWTLMWLVVLPSVTTVPCRQAGLFDWIGVMIGAIPAAGLAALFSQTTVPMIVAMLILQGGIGLLATGALAWSGRDPHGHGKAVLASGILAALGVAAPLVVYLCWEFFPPSWTVWFAAVPVVSVVRAAREGAGGSAIPAAVWWTAVIDALLGAMLYWFSRPPISATDSGASARSVNHLPR